MSESRSTVAASFMPARPRRVGLPSDLRQMTLGVTASVLVGVSLAFAPAAALGILAATAACLVFSAIVLMHRDGWALSLLLVLGLVPVLAGLVQAGVLIQGSVLRSVDDAALAAGWVLLVFESRKLSPGLQRSGAAALVLLLLSELVGLVGLNGSPAVLATGFWRDLRWLGVIGLGLFFVHRFPLERRHRWTFRLLMSWGVGNVVASLVDIARGGGGGLGPSRFSIPLTEGLFGHPSSVGIAGALLVAFGMADRVRPAPMLRHLERNALVLLGLSNVILSTRSKALIALLLALAFLALYPRVRSRLSVVLAVSIIPLLAIPAINFTGSQALSPSSSGTGGLLSDVTSHSRVRSTLLSGARSLASERPPFGYGIATWGSGQDLDREARAATDAGVGGYGFRASNPRFRSDSLVAHVLGERGYLGLALWCLGLGGLALASLRASPSFLFAPAAVLIAVVTSPVAPSFASGPQVLLVLFPAALTLGGPMRSPRRS